MALKSCNYIFNGATSLGEELEFKKNGKIEKWAQKVLKDAHKQLQYSHRVGLFKAVENKAFAEVSRKLDGGKGYKGVFKKADDYLNPLQDILTERRYER
jgi:beta-lysine 5,6-aminomutase alpha subunit